MPTYSYVIRDASGQSLNGSSDAENDEILRKRLIEQGFEVVSIQQSKSAKKKSIAAGGIKKSELAVFCRQFSTMIDAGVSLVRCLTVLSEQARSPKLKAVLNEVRSEVEAGKYLSNALEKFPQAFDRLFIGLVRAGETGGVLEESLQRLSHFLEKEVELRRKVKSALTYPTIVLVFALLVVLLLMTFIIPQFMTLFNDLGIEEMPGPTRMLQVTSAFILNKWYIMIIGVVAFIIAFRAFVKTKFGRRSYDKFKLKIPVLGSLNHKVALARFSRTLATLLSSGVPILSAMETVAGTVANDILHDAIMAARARIREGDQIAEPLAASKMFPPMVTQMISVGQESGALDTMLSKVADFYEDEVDVAVASLTASIEPLLIVSLGFIVGFIVISLFLPLLSIINNLSGAQ
ncbi:MAG: type II secretion system F family protein [Armatimonadota bacterium]